MREDLDVRVRHGGEVAPGLVLLQPQLRVEGPQHDIELPKGLRIHIALALGREVHLDPVKAPDRVSPLPGDGRVGPAERLLLSAEPLLIHPVGDRQSFE